MPVFRVRVQELYAPKVDGVTEIVVLLPETTPAKISDKIQSKLIKNFFFWRKEQFVKFY